MAQRRRGGGDRPTANNVRLRSDLGHTERLTSAGETRSRRYESDRAAVRDSLHHTGQRSGIRRDRLPSEGLRRPEDRSHRTEPRATTPTTRREPVAQAVPQQPKEKVHLFVFGQGLSFDYGVLVCTIVLTVVGLLMVLSSSSYSEGISGDSLGEFRQQVFGAVVGFAGLLVVMNIDYRILKQKWIVMTGVTVTIGLLAAVQLLPHIVDGPPIWSPYVNSAHRWLRIGTRSSYLSIQPSEIAKITMVLYLAWYMDLKHDRMGDIVHTILPMLLVAGCYAGLIVFQPNLSTTGAILMVVLTMLYLGGSKWWVNCSLIALGLGAITFLLLFVYDETRLVRFISFQDPWADPKNTGWQLIQSYFALGNGGWFGTGIGMSRQKHLFLPYSSSDFIFAIVGEELGFVGGTLILAGFFLLVFFGIRVAMNAYDRFGCYLAAGITAMLGIQVIINILVVTGWMPTTGLPLPFFTAGGTTLMIFLSSMGLLLSVSRRQNPLVKKPKNVRRRAAKAAQR